MSLEQITCDVKEKLTIGENFNDSVQQLKELLDADKKFQNLRKEPPYLLRFLHFKDFDVHLAYRMIDDYYRFCLKKPEWFVSGSPLKLKNQIKLQKKGILPNVKDREGRSIFIALLGSMDPDKTSCLENACVDELWIEMVLDEPHTQTLGLAVILDARGLSWKLLQWLTPSNLRNGSKKADLIPIKEYVYHIVNTSMLLNTFVTLVWPVMPARMKQKFCFHYNNWSSLHKHIDPSVLPPEYGGTGPALNFDDIQKTLFDNAAKLEHNLRHQEIANNTHGQEVED